MKSKIFTYSHKPKKIGVIKNDPYLRRRMKEDDSRAVNMSDRKLGRGIFDVDTANDTD